mgnify:CR=1 FL=1
MTSLTESDLQQQLATLGELRAAIGKAIVGQQDVVEQLLIGLLAGGVAHDFNNMLAVILGYTQLVLDRTPADDPSREDLEEVLHAAEHSVGITRQLLAFARQQPVSPEVIDLNLSLLHI